MMTDDLRRTIRKTRRAAYRTGAVLGDVQGALDGPGAYARRRARAYTTRKTMRGLRGAWRLLGLLGKEQ
jgi:hypothetical protein